MTNEITQLKDFTIEVIEQTLELTRVGDYLFAHCPFHDERTPSFVVFDDHYYCFGCGARGDVFDWLKHQRQLSFLDALDYLRGLETPTVRPVRPASPESLKLAGRIWIQALDPRGTIVEKYLRSRGVGLPSTRVVKFHPLCPRRGGVMPAMIAAMLNPSTGQFCGIHRTFLKADGSGTAKPEPKMMLGGSGIIKLADVRGGDLGLTEGIEDALTITLRAGIKCWAAGSASGIAGFPIIPGIKLHVFADNNIAGLTAAQRCADRWGEIKIYIPPGKGDWNDMITGGPR